jgi:hypothetical protein
MSTVGEYNSAYRHSSLYPAVSHTCDILRRLSVDEGCYHVLKRKWNHHLHARPLLREALRLHPPKSSSLHLIIVSPTRIAEMVLELLHECVNLSSCGPSTALHGKSINYRTKDNTREKPDHQPIGKHLIGHTLHLPVGIRASKHKC